LDNAVEALGLTKQFEKVLAVDNLSFSTTKGEIFGFLGPNGAGKTTKTQYLG
jgi:ABC-2 type transport system ATP-binding protein